MGSGHDEDQQHYFGCITAMDLQVGRLRSELKELGIAENTMLWFASDKGPEGDNSNTGTYRVSVGPYRGRKRSLYEGGNRVPGLLEWPARIQLGTTTNISCSTLDYFPTILEVLGLKGAGYPEPRDGASLVPLFEGQMKERPVPIPFETLGGSGSKSSPGSRKLALVVIHLKLHSRPKMLLTHFPPRYVSAKQ